MRVFCFLAGHFSPALPGASPGSGDELPAPYARDAIAVGDHVIDGFGPCKHHAAPNNDQSYIALF